MAKPGGKRPLLKCIVLGSCIGLLGAALFADLLWASSSSNYLSVATSWSVGNSGNRIVHKGKDLQSGRTLMDGHNDGDLYPVSIREGGHATRLTSHRVPFESGPVKDIQVSIPDGDLSKATFDLPAPELEWEEMAEAPVPRLDGAAIQLENLLYVFAGYGTIDYVHSHVDVYNFTDNTWGGRFDMPKEMAHSHLGMVTDGRYIYVVTGQYGPQCRGPTNRNFVLDTETKKWEELPPLPVPRYAPPTQLWRGRLHVMGGSKEDRHEPGLEHWSLAVKKGKALDKEWRSEIPIPRGGPHRSCIVVDDRLFVIGGQEGDFMAKPGSPIFKCSRRHEVVYGDVYMLDNKQKWKQLPSMPKPVSHIEFAWVVLNNSIVILGGTTEKNPVTKRMVLNGEVFQFHLDDMRWSIIGRMPFRIKTTLVGFWDGFLYFTSGQRDRGPNDPSPKKVVGSTWRTKLKLNP